MRLRVFAWLPLLSLLLSCTGAGSRAPGEASELRARAKDRIRTDQRLELIRRAQVWMPTEVASKDLLAGPQDADAFLPLAQIECEYLKPERPGEGTPKFRCRTPEGKSLKVKYGKDNGEVYAEVAATRLLWALGFAADRMYPVRMVCRNCPRNPHRAEGLPGDYLVDPATVELKFPATEVKGKKGSGWAFKELELVNESLGGAPRAHVDALKLLMAFIQHGDNKSAQQRLVCLEQAAGSSEAASACSRPFLMIHDLGATFGGAGDRSGRSAKMWHRHWAKKRIWKDPERCIADLDGSFRGTLQHPAISEEGRRFLAGLLTQLRIDQIADLFHASRVRLRDPSASIEDWVRTFLEKTDQIASHRCPGADASGGADSGED
jgi:hypothetical protein